MTCPSCGKDVPESIFCGTCGAKLDASTVAPATDPIRQRLIEAIGSQYQIERLLGRGGMGSVYLAREEALERLVAIKVLSPEQAGNPDVRERFKREAKTAAKLTHPHIVPLHTFGEAGDLIYFVMGYVRGESLGELMDREGKVPDEAARRILGELANALDYAHRQGVIHRDIKPDNVLIDDETGKAMLTDFGIARATTGGSTLTEVGSVVGTPHYMSPEQASGDRSIDRRTDIFSLGVVGYRMLSGHLPFEGDNIREIIGRLIAEEPPELPQGLGTGVDLGGAIMKSLSKDPANRWQSAAEFSAAVSSGLLEPMDVPLSLKPLDAWAFKLAASIPGGAIAGTIFTAFVAFLDGAVDFWSQVVWIGPMVGLAVPMGYLAAGVQALWRGRKTGLTKNRLKALALQPPKWWRFWWPAKRRRPGDVWDRLPEPLQRAIKEMSVPAAGMGTAMPAFVIFQVLTARGFGGSLVETISNILFGLAVVSVVPVFPALIRVERWLKKKGIHGRELLYAFWVTPLHDPKWLRAPLSQLLGDVSEIQKPTDPRSMMDDIHRRARLLDGSLRELALEVQSGAVELLSSIESLDREIEELFGDVDPGEVERLKKRLSALSSQDGRDDELKRLAENQLELMLRLTSRVAEAEQKRERYAVLMKNLWLHVSDLASRPPHSGDDSGEITGKIRGVCEEIDLQIAAVEEAKKAIRDGGIER